MKLIHTLWQRTLIAVIIGFLLAGVTTKLTYTCTPIDGAQGCISFEKAIMHPNDLLNKQQSSLVKFSTTFVGSSLIALGILSIASATTRALL